MSTTLKFVLGTGSNEALAIKADEFGGAKIIGPGVLAAQFHKTTGGAASKTEVQLTVTDGAAGVEQKRAFQALANAMGGHPREGVVAEIADVPAKKFIHTNITGITAINL